MVFRGDGASNGGLKLGQFRGEERLDVESANGPPPQFSAAFVAVRSPHCLLLLLSSLSLSLFSFLFFSFLFFLPVLFPLLVFSSADGPTCPWPRSGVPVRPAATVSSVTWRSFIWSSFLLLQSTQSHTTCLCGTSCSSSPSSSTDSLFSNDA